MRYVPGTFVDGLEDLDTGDIDLLPDVAYSSDRARTYAFHEVSVLSSWSQVYARAGSGIGSLLDLNGRRIVFLEGSIQQQAFKQLASSFGISATLLSAPDYEAALEMVADGEAEAVITNRFYGVAHAGDAGLEDTGVVFAP